VNPILTLHEWEWVLVKLGVVLLALPEFTTESLCKGYSTQLLPSSESETEWGLNSLWCWVFGVFQSHKVVFGTVVMSSFCSVTKKKINAGLYEKDQSYFVLIKQLFGQENSLW
jgi:hypothetical protein